MRPVLQGPCTPTSKPFAGGALGGPGTGFELAQRVTSISPGGTFGMALEGRRGGQHIRQANNSGVPGDEDSQHTVGMHQSLAVGTVRGGGGFAGGRARVIIVFLGWGALLPLISSGHSQGISACVLVSVINHSILLLRVTAAPGIFLFFF